LAFGYPKPAVRKPDNTLSESNVRRNCFEDAQILTFVDSPWPGGGLGKNNFTVTSKTIRPKSGEENRAIA
jgi:hypothetical protein